MIKLNPAILLYLTALILYACSIFFENQNLELFCRPIIIPTVYYFYFTCVRGRINYLFTISILSFFIGEILFLISQTDFLIPGLICYLLPYFIVTFFLCQDFLFYLKKKEYKINSLSFYIIFLLLLYLIYNSLFFVIESPKIEFSIYILFGILLFFMGIISFLIQFNFNNRTILFMGLMVISFVVSDLFFIFSTRMRDVIALQMINLITQQLSYFLYAGYFIYRSRYKVYGNRNASKAKVNLLKIK